MAGLGDNARILVTGATGFLGGQFARRLRQMGVGVVAVGRDRAKCADLRALGCDVIEHDITLPFGPRDDLQIDAVVHCAALSAPFGKRRDFMRTNVDGTRNVLTLAARSGVRRFVHISTPSVYFSYCDQINVAETMALPLPVNHYAATKRLAEEMVIATGNINPVILRPRGIYGAGDTALLPRVLRAARQSPLPFLRDGRARIDLTHVDDVVDAMLAALHADETAIGGIFNISSGEVLAVRQIVEDCCRRSGIAVRWRKTPLRPAMWAARAIEAAAQMRGREPAITRYGLGLFAFEQSLDISKARDVLGWSPKVKFVDGLARTFGQTT